MKELEAIMDKNALDESAKNELTEDEMKKEGINADIIHIKVQLI